MEGMRLRSLKKMLSSPLGIYELLLNTLFLLPFRMTSFYGIMTKALAETSWAIPVPP